jgi:hypothetical protein
VRNQHQRLAVFEQTLLDFRCRNVEIIGGPSSSKTSAGCTSCAIKTRAFAAGEPPDALIQILR